MIGILLWYTHSRFLNDTGQSFITKTNLTAVLIIAIPLAIAAFAQTHALLVGYLDLSVGAMISLGGNALSQPWWIWSRWMVCLA